MNQPAEIGKRSGPKPLWKQPRKWIAGYLFAGPAIILLIVFSLISIGVSLYLSFFDYDIISRGGPFIALGNYREALFEDELFWTALLNTALYALGVVPGITIFAFLLAFAGHRVTVGRSVFRTIYFLPSITPLSLIAPFNCGAVIRWLSSKMPILRLREKGTFYFIDMGAAVW